MSNKIPSFAAGLTALGLSLSTTWTVADEPTPPAPLPAAIPPAAPSSPQPATYTVLLLSNGQVLRGEIVEDDAGYLVRHKFGEFVKKRREVEQAFATIQDAYKYKRERTPRRDPDELMRLARWCLDQKLPDEARVALEELARLDPQNREARAMLSNVVAQAERAASRDTMVARTANEVVEPPVAPGAPGAPGTLDLGGLRERMQGRVSGPPVILDLPPAVAVRRYEEFARGVHPVLQKRCANCHNEQNRNTKFQMVQVRSRKDAGNEMLLRTNLDAVVTRLIDAQNPANSWLLTRVFIPHESTRQPLFTGPNDPAYRIISAWVNGLRESDGDPATTPAAAPSGFVPPGTAGAPVGPGFATARTGGAAVQVVDQADQSAPVPPGRARVVRGRTPGNGVPNFDQTPTIPPVDANFNTTSPTLLPGPNNAPIQPPAGTPPKPAAPVANAPAYLTDDKGNPILDPATGKPIPIAPTNAKPRGKGKTFNLDPTAIQQMLNKPR